MLIYNYHPNPTGGAEKQCRLQARELLRQGHDCVVLTARNRSGLPRREIDDGAEIVRVAVLQPFMQRLLRIKHRFAFEPTPGVEGGGTVKNEHFGKASRPACISEIIVYNLNALSFMWGTALFLYGNRKSIDIIHTHIASWNAGFAGWIGHKLGIPVVCKASYLPVFDDFKSLVPFNGRLNEWRKRIHYIALTTEMRDDLVGQEVPAANVRLIPNGVVLPEIPADVGSHDWVVYVGNLTQGVQHKGFDVLLKAWAVVHREVPELKLIVAGKGDASSWIKLSQELGCEDSVCFSGYIKDMPDLYEKSSVFVLPSRGEGISNALLEAQSHGVPAVVSDIPGNRAVVVDGTTGFVTPVDDADAMAAAIIKLINDRSLRCKMGELARERMNAHYSICSVVERIVQYYRDLSLQGRA